MNPEQLEEIARSIRDQQQRVTALARMLRYGVLIDSMGIARRLAAEIHQTARALEEETNQLELLPPERGQESQGE